MKTFPTIVLGIFVALGLLGMIIFATYSSMQKDSVGAVRIWGPLPTEMMQPVLDAVRENNSSFDRVSYEFKSGDTLVPDLVAAIASGRGPDLVFFPASHLLSNADKLVVIPYATYSRRSFQDTFIEAGEIFLFADGVTGLPVLIDPLVMYWNRSLFSAAGIAEPPRYWDDLSASAPGLSQSDEKGTLVRSAAALGTWENVSHAKAILLSILRQLGNPVIALGEDGYQSVLQQEGLREGFSADSALRFYTDFADPVKSVYSWNRSQPNSRDAFIGGQLAVYFGRASELFGIRQTNPNLNFDVAPIPAIRGGTGSVSADVVGLAIPRGSQNPSGAFTVAQALTTPEVLGVLESELRLPSVLRGQRGGESDNAYSIIFKNAALASFAFLDPDPSTTDSIFARMVGSVSSGNLTVSEAITNASGELRSLVGVQ